MSDILRLEHVTRRFGGLVVTDDLSLRVAVGERRALIGPNGAGKTTLFNLISGVLPVSSGQIWLQDQNITARPAAERAILGIGRTFQRNNLFAGLSVFENVCLAARRQQGLSSRVFRPAHRYAAVAEAAQGVLAQVGLLDRAGSIAGQLAYGQQRALEIAVALAARPRLLLLDEPTSGMAPAETNQMIDLIARLPPDLTLLIIEHDIDAVFRLANQITVLSFGSVLAEGAPDAVRQNAQVQEIYLGLPLERAD
ncbi:MAG: ABC transporter ATP-binding protein [Roseiflexaceae bacterium]|nr:ABC transporter ATP-binding protein [Roseiflexaceae bacterium]